VVSGAAPLPWNVSPVVGLQMAWVQAKLGVARATLLSPPNTIAADSEPMKDRLDDDIVMVCTPHSAN